MGRKAKSRTSGEISGVTGVTFDRTNALWEARLDHNSKTILRKKFKDLTKAIAARKAAEAAIRE